MLELTHDGLVDVEQTPTTCPAEGGTTPQLTSELLDATMPGPSNGDRHNGTPNRDNKEDIPTETRVTMVEA